MDCLRITENNEWEGERWNFYFTASPEIDAELHALIDAIGDDSYEISDKRFTPDVVKVLLENANDECTYMDAHNYVGELTSLPTAAEFEDGDPFYKGGFGKFCTFKPL